jgi:single-strand DNA-binding protein
MVAKVTLIGNLGRKPEIKETNGKRFARFSVAVNRYVNKEKATMWVDCVCWDEKKVEVLDSFADKGTKVYVEGALEKRTYTKDGVEKLAVEVSIGRFSGELQLLTRAEDGGSGGSPSTAIVLDDDMPF